MIQDIAAHRTYAAHVSSQTPSLGVAGYRVILGAFALLLTLSTMALVQMSVNM